MVRAFCLIFLITLFQTANCQFIDASIHYKSGDVEKIKIDKQAFFFDPFLVPEEKRGILIGRVSQVNIADVIYFPELVSYQTRDSLLFLEKVIDGKLSVYTTPRESKNVSFILKKEGRAIVLKSAREQYRAVLRAVSNDCSTLSEKNIRRVNFNYESIYKFIDSYNQTCGWTILKEEMLSTSRFRISTNLILGYSSSDIELKESFLNNYFFFRPNENELVGNRLFYGVGLDLKFERITFTNNLIFENFSSDITYQNVKEEYAGTLNIHNISSQFYYSFTDLRNQLSFHAHIF